MIGTVGPMCDPYAERQDGVCDRDRSDDGRAVCGEYLSLHNPDTANPNEPVNLANGAVQVQVTITDGDGDTATSNVLNIGAEIDFRDDAPTAPTVTVSDGSVAVDETPGVQTAADPNPANDVLSTAVPAAILAKFDAIGAARGVDSDVAPGSLDDGALSFAASSGSLVSLGRSILARTVLRAGRLRLARPTR